MLKLKISLKSQDVCKHKMFPNMHIAAYGFCQVEKKKKNQRKIRKWVGGSSPNSDFLVGEIVFLLYVVFMFPNVSKKNKKTDGGWVAVV